MSAGVKKAWLVGLVFAAPQLGMAQDREFPVLNSVGRYLGIGYTRGGYHAPHDGRLDIVTKRHPASDYRHGGLPHYSLPYSHSSISYPDAPAVEVIPTPPPASPCPVIPGSAVPGATVPSTTAPSGLPTAQVGPPGAQPGTAILSPAPSEPSQNVPALTAGPNTQSAAGFPAALSHALPSELLIALQNEPPRGLPPGVVTLPPPPTTQPLPVPPATSPVVVSSPKDKIEVRDLAPPATPQDALLDSSHSHRLPARGVSYPIIDRQVGSDSASHTNRYLSPPTPTHSP